MADEAVLLWPVDSSGYEIADIDDYYSREKDGLVSKPPMRHLKATLEEIRREQGLDHAKTQCIRASSQYWRPRDFASLMSVDDTDYVDTHVRYAPMSVRGLYLDFAALEETPEAARRFADKYGMLESPDGAEALDGWYMESRRLAMVAAMYSLASRAADLVTRIELAGFDSAESSEYLAALEKATGQLRTLMSLNVWVRPAVSVEDHKLPRPLRRIRGKDPRENIIDAAFCRVRREVNVMLTSEVTGVLCEPEESSPETGGLSYVPHSLLAALWLQFALEITYMRKPAVCQHCGGLFWLETSYRPGRERSQRSDTKYCSSRCRVAACRKRQKSGANADLNDGHPAIPE